MYIFSRKTEIYRRIIRCKISQSDFRPLYPVLLIQKRNCFTQALLGGAVWADAQPIFFLHKHSFFFFFAYWVEEGQIKKQKYFQNDCLDGAGTEKNGKLAFYRTQNRGILVPMVDFVHPSPPTYLDVISQFTPMKLAIHHLFPRFSIIGGIAPLMLNTWTGKTLCYSRYCQL